MKKEIIICIAVVFFIVVLNIITQNHTNKSMDEIQLKLSQIREELISNNTKDLREQSIELKNIWKEKSEILTYYIEHDEIEKVEHYIWEINSNVETNEYDMAIQSLDTCDFIISHIKDKYKFSLKNIF